MHPIVSWLNRYGLLGIGKDAAWEGKTIHERKTVVLTNQISVLIVIICLVFSFFDYTNGIVDTQLFYMPLAFVAILSYWLNRNKKHSLAKHIIIVTSLITTFYFSLRAPQETFTGLMYFPIVIGTFALFGYRKLWVGILYFSISLVLFLLDNSESITYLAREEISQDLLEKTRVINYVIISVTMVFLLLFILSINFQTERKIKEQNEELKKTNHELDKFVYSTSHDLRAPLMSILGLVNIAEIEGDQDKIEECLKMIKERVHTLDNFITEIIDISRNKKSDLQISSFNVRESVNEILENFRYMEHFDRIRFDLEIPEQLEISSDVTRFSLIMRNLISNAIKYHNFMLEEPCIKVSCEPEEFTLKIKVTDNGHGIEDQYQSKLFDMFFRGTQNGKGTGLGLYIVKETALKLDGKISLESKIGKGSTFELEIPNVRTAV